MDERDRGAGVRLDGDGGAYGTYDEDFSEHRSRFARQFDPFGRFEALPDLFRRLGAEVSSMLQLQIALLKAEIRDGVTGYAKGGVFFALAAVPAVLTVIFLEVAFGFLLAALFPFSPAVNYGLGFGIVMLLNAIVAGVLAWIGLKEFKKHSLVPERSIQEMERDKQWLTTEVM